MGSSTDNSGLPMGFARLCVGGCGFFGTPEKQGMCSKCFVASSTALVIADVPPSVEKHETAKTDDEAVLGPAEEPVAAVVKKGRCGQCNKKVGLLGFVCPCGDTFCGTHRYPNEHACGFDYKEAGKKVIQERNPVIKADKIEHRI